MGFLDKAKNLLGDHKDKVEDGIEKAADLVDEKTGGKYSEHIDTGADKAKDVIEGLADEEE
jgi:hypothetical protein